MIDERAQAFLAQTRLGFLSHRDDVGWSRPVPVWFDWRGDAALVFSWAASPKVKRLRRAPSAHLLVANQVGEPEAWVSLTADVEFGSVDGSWLEALSGRYWDLRDSDRRAAVDRYLERLDALVLLRLVPVAVRSWFY